MSTTAGSRRPALSRSASSIVAGTASGQHLLKIDGYSRTKDEVPTGSDIKSRSFRVGGHSWHISFYPNGFNPDSANSISIFLVRDDSVNKSVKAQHKFSLLDRAGKPSYSASMGETKDFGNWGFGSFITREKLEKSEYLRDDCFTIMCEFTVFKELQTEDLDVATATPPPPAVVVPPSDLHRHLGGLLATGKGADVAFEVDGKTFVAHSNVLAARSPVFHAELFSQEKESGGAAGGGAAIKVVRVDDMEAQDFEALLRYVYTDALPPETKGGEAAAMLPDLVAAANRYKMERLKLVCEDKLCEHVNGRTVATMLAFAEEHHCDGLKASCLHFLNDQANLRAIVESDGMEHMIKNCPSVFKDLIAKFVAAAP